MSTFRITITLNEKNYADAQILAACEAAGGSSAAVIKTHALRSIMSAQVVTPTTGFEILTSAKNTSPTGKGFSKKNIKKSAPKEIQEGKISSAKIEPKKDEFESKNEANIGTDTTVFKEEKRDHDMSQIQPISEVSNSPTIPEIRRSRAANFKGLEGL